jgi:hypothetical protein
MTIKLTAEEQVIVASWRPSEKNPICRCSGDHICEYHALIAIIDRLTGEGAASRAPLHR